MARLTLGGGMYAPAGQARMAALQRQQAKPKQTPLGAARAERTLGESPMEAAWRTEQARTRMSGLAQRALAGWGQQMLGREGVLGTMTGLRYFKSPEEGGGWRPGGAARMAGDIAAALSIGGVPGLGQALGRIPGISRVTTAIGSTLGALTRYLGGKAATTAGGEAVEQAVKKTLSGAARTAAREAGEEAVEQAAKTVAREAAEQVAKTGIREGTAAGEEAAKRTLGQTVRRAVERAGEALSKAPTTRAVGDVMAQVGYALAKTPIVGPYLAAGERVIRGLSHLGVTPDVILAGGAGFVPTEPPPVETPPPATPTTQPPGSFMSPPRRTSSQKGGRAGEGPHPQARGWLCRGGLPGR